MELSLGYITAPTHSEAKELVMMLLEEELIACANIVEGAESYFNWEGELQKARESLIILKTRAKNEEKIIKLVQKYHSYECPCVVFVPLIAGNPDYLKWVDEAC